MLLGMFTSLLLPVVEAPLLLALVFGVAGLGVAAFTPSALSVVGDAAPPTKTAQAFGWYSTAHYGAIAIGPFLGGLVADWVGHRGTLVVSGLGIGLALVVGGSVRVPTGAATGPGGGFAEIKNNTGVWAGWILAVSGMLVQGVVFTFLPLLAHAQGLSTGAIGTVFLVLGLANTLARWPAGWLIDRTGRRALYALGGVLAAALTTALVPLAGHFIGLVVVAAVFGAASGLGFVAITAGLALASSPTMRGFVMGGYSTAMYLGLALGSFTLGPVIAGRGYTTGFLVGASIALAGTLAAALLYSGGTACRAQSTASCRQRGR
jgi:predicted MFS family arabinose efflux permease